MKPKIGVVFPKITDKDIADLEIEKIRVSKNRRKIGILLGSDTSAYQQAKVESEVKKACNLTEVIVRVDNRIKQQDKNVMIYEVEPGHEGTMQSASSGPKIKGKANVSDMLYGRPINDDIISIHSINDNSGRVVFSGKVFFVEDRDIKSKKTGKEFHLITMDITDNEDSISAKMFVTKTEDDEPFNKLFSKLKKGVKGGGIYIVARGKAQFDQYAGETIVMINDIAEIEKPPVRMDEASEKRVELHLHTQMSAMDAVSSVNDLINRAIYWGHKAIAVTDHGVVQSFPDAMKASNFNEKIKILYGVEGYLIDDSKKIVYNAENQNIDSPFVVFDIETTGLHNDKNNITEIGAVKVVNGQIVDKWSTFVNPCQPIPENIVELTGITDSMVADAPKIEEILGEFFEFCKDCILVAHNAAFDIGFIKKAAERHNFEFNFCYLDTLMLARCMYPELPNFKLDTLTKHLHVILENHHRAVDDAKATADVFVKMIEKLREEDKTELKTFNDIFDLRSASKKNKAYHIIILAKNQIGLRHIYEMISESHLKYFFRTPRIPRSLLEEKREGLILGSACEAGELFRAMIDGDSDEELKEIVDFYDYLEIQPIGNNAYMKTDPKHPMVNTDEDLQNLNRRIVALGEKYNKPVVATCDVHFMDMEGADYRKILMNYKGFSDADNQAPLYFRTTEEMLKEFEYLGKEKAYEVVVKNTNLVADMIEDVRPIPAKKCPPVIEGAKEGIINDSTTRAKEIYGDPLPEIVQKRLDKELHSITTYGFSVMYRIAQELVRHSLADGYLVGSRGSVGSSLVAYLSDITEVNSLQGHYICPNCKNVEFIESEIGLSGCDLPDKVCPKCGTKYRKDGHDIPFETFLGFKGDKEPDIDLNFSGVYQPVIHKYTETFFGKGKVFKAGTIGTVAEKTAFGYVKNYYEEHGQIKRTAEIDRISRGCQGIRRSTGQHPGGIVIVPRDKEIYEFTPIQKPANDMTTDIITTHFEYHAIDANLLKLDILGHDDPTMIRRLEKLTNTNVNRDVPINDPKVMSLFTGPEALGITSDDIDGCPTGSLGLPELGTDFVIQMLVDTKPTKISDLVNISGLSHGTDVWLGNAQTLIEEGRCTISTAICTRDDIMVYLMHKGIEPQVSFQIMEHVRKGKGLQIYKDKKSGKEINEEEVMHQHNVPDWYIGSCKKIKYMFPKAHAAAYIMMALRVAWYKVYIPLAYYAAYFAIRAKAFNYETMCRGKEKLEYYMADLKRKKANHEIAKKDEDALGDMKVVQEMYARGFEFMPIDIYKAKAHEFQIIDNKLMPSLDTIEGLGEKAADGLVEAVANQSGPFVSKNELREKSKLSKTVIETMSSLGLLEGMPEDSQLSIFDF